MSVIKALILGILQGLTEFLPISSSGHLLLFENLLGIKNGDMFFNVLLHLASLLAVVIFFWKDVVELIKKPFSDKMKILFISTIPTIVIAIIIKYSFNDYELNAFLGFGFLISAILLLITYCLNRKENFINIEVNKKKGFIIGLVQGIAVLPGISRSGSTICAGLLQGVKREECAKFSFLLSIPVILGATILETYEGIKIGFYNINVLSCIIGFLASFVVALFSIKLMLNVVKKGNWIWFSIYLFVLSIFTILNEFVLCLF